MKLKRIVWAINPFEEERKLPRKAAALLKTLSARARAEIEPVYVVSPAELRASLEFSVPEKERLYTVAKRALDRALEALRFPGLLDPRVLVTSGVTLEATARTLSRHAERTGAELIVFGTHARAGIDRLFLGSFAETLVLLSPAPVLLVNPRLKPGIDLGRAVFATDFSPQSRAAFRRFCDTFAPMGAKIILYHALPKPPRWIIRGDTSLSVGGRVPSLAKRLREKAATARKLATPFLREARIREARVELRVEETEGKIYDAILRQAAKTRASVIGMASRSGKLSATLFGSASRGVARQSPIPVWIFHA